MTELIAHLLRILMLLFPARGKHRSTPASRPAHPPASRPRRSLPEHRSPYARESAERRTFVDTLNPVRPYVTAGPRLREDDPKRRAQAERRWALDMALRGIDVGPTVIHGRRVPCNGHGARVTLGV